MTNNDNDKARAFSCFLLPVLLAFGCVLQLKSVVRLCLVPFCSVARKALCTGLTTSQFLNPRMRELRFAKSATRQRKEIARHPDLLWKPGFLMIILFR